MSEYVIDGKGNAYRRVYILFHDGEEIGALLSIDAVTALIDGAVQQGAEDSFYYNDYLQPVKFEEWIEDSMRAVYGHRVESEAGPIRKAVYTSEGWKAYDEV